MSQTDTRRQSRDTLVEWWRTLDSGWYATLLGLAVVAALFLVQVV